jgi:hypothetical protein
MILEHFMPKKKTSIVTPHFNLYSQLDDGQLILMTKDHILPACKGGPNHIDNMQTMCYHCNSLKDDDILTLEQLRERVNNHVYNISDTRNLIFWDTSIKIKKSKSKTKSSRFMMDAYGVKMCFNYDDDDINNLRLYVAYVRYLHKSLTLTRKQQVFGNFESDGIRFNASKKIQTNMFFSYEQMHQGAIENKFLIN